MVHHQFDAFLVGVCLQRFDVEVGIGLCEAEVVVFLPQVFPSLVPSFYEELVEPVPGCKVDVASDIVVVGGMSACGLEFRVVGLSESYRLVVGIVPCGCSGHHFPPYAHVFDGMNPRRVFQFAWLVEVEYQVGCEHLPRIIHHHDGSPWRGIGAAYESFPAFGVRREDGFEHHPPVVECEVHGGVVDECCLVDVDVESVVGLHQQGGLCAGCGNG